MELKLIALTLFVLILIYFNYRRYKRMERQRAILHQARNGLIFESSSAGSTYPRSINITTRNPRHQIAIIFPGSDLSYQTQTEANNNNGSGVHPSQLHPDLPPSYYDLFSESELKGAGPGSPGVGAGGLTGSAQAPTNINGRCGNINTNTNPPPPPPTYGQIMSDSSGQAQSTNNANPPGPATNSGPPPPAPERY